MHGIQSDRQKRLALIAEIREAAFLISAAHLELLLEHRANFNPNQPRVPRGYRHGGRWTEPGDDRGGLAQSTDSGRPRVVLANHEPEEPEVPEQRPASARERNSIGRRVARFLIDRAYYLPELFARAAWLANEAGASIRSYLDEPRSLWELRERAEEPRPGYDVHHIVEKTPAYQAGYTREMIESADNKVLVPRYKHWEITAWYATRNPRYGGLTPREFLRNAPWRERVKVGLFALERHGVLK